MADIPESIDLYSELIPSKSQSPYPSAGSLADLVEKIEKKIKKIGQMTMGTSQIDLGTKISITGVAYMRDDKRHLTEESINYQYKLHYDKDLDVWLGKQIDIV